MRRQRSAGICESLTRAVVDELVGGSHGSQRVSTRADFLIHRIVVERVRIYIRHRFGHLEIFVSQCAHVVELVVEERHSTFDRRRACGNRRESHSLLRLVALGREPVVGERDSSLYGVFQGGVPFPHLGHRFDPCGHKILRKTRGSSGKSRTVGCGSW